MRKTTPGVALPGYPKAPKNDFKNAPQNAPPGHPAGSARHRKIAKTNSFLTLFCKSGLVGGVDLAVRKTIQNRPQNVCPWGSKMEARGSPRRRVFLAPKMDARGGLDLFFCRNQ